MTTTTKHALPYQPIELLSLLRLARVLRQRREYSGVVPVTDWRMRALDRAAYSLFWDAVNLGLSEDARALVKREREGEK